MSTYHISGTLRAGYMSLVLYCQDGNRILSQDNEDSVKSDFKGYELPRAPRKRVGPSTA